ncbi:MAG: Hsp20 family protein [Planctomycetota bacterium]
MHASKFGAGEGVRDWSRRMQDIMDEMRHRSFCDYRASGTWMPTVNIYASQSAYYLCVELAGLDPESVAVQCVDPQHVRIQGQRARPEAPGLDGPCSFELMEIDEGPFDRVIDFSEPVDTRQIAVSWDRGYVWIVLRKAEAK